MKKIYIILALALSVLAVNTSKSYAQQGQELVDICAMISDDATYLKDFQVKLDAAKPGEDPPQQIFSVLLQKDTQYRFSICNSKDYNGKAILQLYDNNRLLGSSYIVATGKHYPNFDLKIQKTGVYHIFISFQDGEQGLAVALLSYVKRL